MGSLWKEVAGVPGNAIGAVCGALLCALGFWIYYRVRASRKLYERQQEELAATTARAETAEKSLAELELLYRRQGETLAVETARAESAEKRLVALKLVGLEVLRDSEETWASLGWFYKGEEDADPATHIQRFDLSVRLALQFYNHDTAYSTVTRLDTELWLSETERANHLRIREWRLTAPSGHLYVDFENLHIEVPGRKLSGIYRLDLNLGFAAEIRAKAETEHAFVRLIVHSTGHTPWFSDLQLAGLLAS